MKVLRQEFEKNGYIVLENLLSKEICDLVTQYALFSEMQNFNNFEFDVNMYDLSNTHSKYSDPLIESILLKIQNNIETSLDMELFPTYSFYRVYRNGSILNKHIDRPSCEISCTLCFNYSYDDSEYNWPIYMNKIPINLKSGDAAIYKGMDVEHWRERFDCSNDDWQVQGFLHYVNADGKYKEYKWDQRSSLGLSINQTNKEHADNQKIKKIKEKKYLEFIEK
jgi:hypothetical protein